MPSTENNETIDETIDIAAAPERVFRALTEADELATWMPTRAESEPQAGGRFAYSYQFTDKSRDHDVSGAYARVEPVRSLAYPWSVEGLDRPTTVEFTLTPQGDGTRLHLVHSGWEGAGAQAFEAHKGGWTFFLANLKSVLEGGPDQRAKALGMVVRG